MILTPHDQAAAALADRLASTLILRAIGDFSRATGSLSRITDPGQRLKVIGVLSDFARHLVERLDAELTLVVQDAAAAGSNGHHQPEEGK